MTDSTWQPNLEGRFLRLRPLTSEDFDSLHMAASDPAIWKMHPEQDRYKKENFARYFQSGMESGGALVILDRNTNRVIGSSRFTRHDARNAVIEIGYTFLVREFWGKGYNRELKTLMLNHAFQFVNKVHFYIGQQNLRSRRAIEKLPSSLVRIETPAPAQDHARTSVVYEITRQSWEAYQACTHCAP